MIKDPIKAFIVMFTLFVMLIAFLLLLSDAEAQDVIPVNIERSKFVWNWDQGAGDAADFFRVICQAIPTAEVFTSDTVGLIKEMPVGQVLSVRGTYECHVRAVNVAGDSDPSNVVDLKIVGKASSPTVFRIESN